MWPLWILPEPAVGAVDLQLPPWLLSCELERLFQLSERVLVLLSEFQELRLLLCASPPRPEFLEVPFLLV